MIRIVFQLFRRIVPDIGCITRRRAGHCAGYTLSTITPAY